MTLEEYRNEIDRLDKELVKILEKRFLVVHEIGLYKKANNLPILDLEREKKVLESKRLIVNDDSKWQHYEKIFKLIMDVSKDLEK